VCYAIFLYQFPLSVTHLVVLGSFVEGDTSIGRAAHATEEETKKFICLVTRQRAHKDHNEDCS